MRQFSTDQLSSSAQTSSGDLLHYGIPISKATGAKLQFKAVCQDGGGDRESHEALSTWFSCRAKKKNYFLLHFCIVLLGAGHWLRHTDLQVACSCTSKISFLKNIQHSWTPFPSRTASQSTLSSRLLKRLKSAIQKVKWKGGSPVDPSP